MIKLFNHWFSWRSVAGAMFDFSFLILTLVIALLWVSHGLQDMVIPLAQAQRIREHFGALPVALDGADFPGAHELRPAELQQWIGWLNRTTSKETT